MRKGACGFSRPFQKRQIYFFILTKFFISGVFISTQKIFLRKIPVLGRAKTVLLCHEEIALKTLSGSQFWHHIVAITGPLVELPHPRV